MIASVHPVGIHCTEVLNLKLDQGFRQFRGVAKSDGELIYQAVSEAIA